jgi:predicted nucleotidyltransferase component of viral defense system
LTKGKPTNVAASVRQRLLNIAHKTKQDFGLLITKYALERLLYRLSVSAHRNVFVLKGALLFDLWILQPHRPTRDLDLLGRGDSSLERYRKIFVDVCTQPVETDGLNFPIDRIRADRIRDEEEYEGVRVLMEARLGAAQISLQVDVGFGDVILPGPVEVEYPTMLDFPAPKLQAYPRETVVAEKFEAMVKLGMANSRMKDFYDLWELAERFDYEGPTLAQAVQATFERRGTPFPSGIPLALTAEFYEAATKQIQWRAFLKKSGLAGDESLPRINTRLREFLLPICDAVQKREAFARVWRAGGPWSPLS